MKIDRSLGRIYTYIHKSTMFSNDLGSSVKLQHSTLIENQKNQRNRKEGIYF